jgi:hypothetical protein
MRTAAAGRENPGEGKGSVPLSGLTLAAMKASPADLHENHLD